MVERLGKIDAFPARVAPAVTVAGLDPSPKRRGVLNTESALGSSDFGSIYMALSFVLQPGKCGEH